MIICEFYNNYFHIHFFFNIIIVTVVILKHLIQEVQNFPRDEPEVVHLYKGLKGLPVDGL